MSASRIPVRSVSPQVEAMLQEEGVYFAGDSRNPKVMLPLVSLGGDVYVLVRGSKIDPFRFLPTMTLSGPYLPPQEDAAR